MEEIIFKNASTTYYWSSKFFPAPARADVFKLYSFVRITDDFVDQIPQDLKSFYDLKQAWEARGKSKNPVINKVVDNMEYLCEKYGLDHKWISAFLGSMQQDLTKQSYKTLDESMNYIYGSSEVIGLMVAKILGLPEESFEAAKRQGRAMQWINFIRDIDEDNHLGRSYFPISDYKKFGFKDLNRETIKANPESYKNFIRLQLDRYKQWQIDAEAGYKYIPKRLLIPIKTASDMYAFTARKIEEDPFVVFEKKVKPSKPRVIQKIFSNSLKIHIGSSFN